MSNKVRTKKIVKIQKKLTLDESVKTIGDRVDRFMKAMDAKMGELVQKHNDQAAAIGDLQKVQQQIATFAASEFGKVLGQQQAIAMELGKSIDHLDVNVLALAEVSKEVFGQFQQLDYILQNGAVVDGKLITDIPDTAIPEIKDGATKWHTDVVSAAFKTVVERRQAEETNRAKAAAQVQEEALQAAIDRDEAAKAENELRAAESASIISQGAGGSGVDIPVGADVYGG